MGHTRVLFRGERLIRFLIVGASNTVISYLVFLLGYYLLFVGNALFAQPLSYGTGIVWSFVWNRKWTFQSSAGVGREFIRFTVVQIILLFLSTGLVHLVVDRRNINASIGWILVMTLITGLNFILTKKFVFSSQR